MTLTLFYLFLVSHGALSSDHDFAAGLQLELLGSHTTGTQNSSNKIELKIEKQNWTEIEKRKYWIKIENKTDKL